MSPGKLIYGLFLLPGLLTAVVPAQSHNLSDTLRVLSFNIYGAPDSNWPVRRSMILDNLVELQPDIIALQEVVETPGTGGADNRARILSDSLYFMTGTHYEYRWQRTHFSWNQFDEGIAVLSRYPILDSGFIELPPGLFSRKALWCRVLTPAGIVNFFDTHLSFGNQEAVRLAQVRSLKQYVAGIVSDSTAVLTFVSGDFNTGPVSPPIELMVNTDSLGMRYLDTWREANPGQNGYTIPSDNPSDRIDYVFLLDNHRGRIHDLRLVFDQSNTENIYPSDHIGVLGTFTSTLHKPQISIISPLAGAIVSGETPINWSIASPPEPLSVTLYLSSDGGRSWWQEFSGPAGGNPYNWNTLQVDDGSHYLLRIVAEGDSSFAMAQTSGTFTVNNPGNAAPEIDLRSPRGGELASDIWEVQWDAADADGDSLSIALDFTTNGGRSWQTLVTGFPNTGVFSWNTRGFPNSPFYRMRLRCSDQSVETADTSQVFEVYNERIVLPQETTDHIAGTAGAAITVLVVDPDSVRDGNRYRITFDDSSSGSKSYRVRNLTSGDTLVENATQIDGVTEGPAFEGLRLVINDFDPPQVNPDSTRWHTGTSTLELSVFLPTLNIDGQIITGTPWPADYSITFFDSVVDTSSSAFGAPPTPMKFKVRNLSADRLSDVIFLDADNNLTLSQADMLYLLEPDSTGNPIFIWALFASGQPDAVLPQAGDEYIIATLKPLTRFDIYEFVPGLTAVGESGPTVPQEFKLFQNYPNPFNSSTTIRYFLPRSAGVTLRVFNLLGQEIRTLVDEQRQAGEWTVQWDGRNQSGGSVGSGIYIVKLLVEEQAASSRANVVTSKKMLLIK